MTVNIMRPAPAPDQSQARLYLKEDELDRAVDLFVTASRRFWRSALAPLAELGLGPAHFRALSAIRRDEGLAVGALRERLGVRKQSLARVLDELDKAGLVTRAAGAQDRRERRLLLTPAGRLAEEKVAQVLRERIAAVFRSCGAEAVSGARAVLAALAADSAELDEDDL
jgi:DNA-binding MarR family transcriptional regulator